MAADVKHIKTRLNMPTKIIGVILAGGQSKRMGYCKTQLRWRGNTLLTHQQNLFDSLNLPYLVSGPRGIPDNTGGISQGPLQGISACLASRPTASMLFIPIDMPLLSKGLLIELIEAAPITASRYYNKFPLPCLIGNTPQVRHIANTLAQAPGRSRSISNFLKAIHAIKIQPGDHSNALSVQANTPEEWENLIQQN